MDDRTRLPWRFHGGFVARITGLSPNLTPFSKAKG